MNKDDIIIWYRFYLWDGESVDKMFEPLTYSSHRDFVDAFNEAWTEYSNQDQDYDIVDYEHIDERAAYGMYDDSKVWDGYNSLFDLTKEYGVSTDVMFELVSGYGWGIEQLEDVMENAYEGEHNNMFDFAVYLVEEELLNKDHYEWYFDYANFGRELSWDIDDMLIDMDYSHEEAEEITNMRDEDLAEWYIDMIGGLEDLGQETLSNYLDYRKIEQSLEAEGYLDINGYIFRPY